MKFLRRQRPMLAPLAPLPPCLNDPNCALTLGHQWCTCYSPALTFARENRIEDKP